MKSFTRMMAWLIGMVAIGGKILGAMSVTDATYFLAVALFLFATTANDAP